LAPAAARQDRWIVQFRRTRAAELERRKAETAQSLHETETRFLIIGERMGLRDAPIRAGQPNAFRLGDEIADRQNEPAFANDDAASRPLDAQDRSGESVRRNHRAKRDHGFESAVEIEAEFLSFRLIAQRRFPAGLFGHGPFPVSGK
jgi:hypothetical protein